VRSVVPVTDRRGRARAQQQGHGDDDGEDERALSHGIPPARDELHEPDIAVIRLRGVQFLLSHTLRGVAPQPADAAASSPFVAAIGFGVDVAPGTGPVVERPFRSEADLARLRPLEPELDTPYVLETIRLLAGELDVPLIGFAGAPFTVASYLVEGRSSRTYAL